MANTKKDLPPDFNGIILLAIKKDGGGYEKGDVLYTWPHTATPSERELNHPDWRVMYVDGMTMADAEIYLNPLREIDGRTIIKHFRRGVAFDKVKLDKDKVKDMFVKSDIDDMKKVKEIPPTPQPDVIEVT